jgi:tetratricopeptide (TPR) repeat protein
VTPLLVLALAASAGPVMVLPPVGPEGDVESAWVGEVVADAMPRDLAAAGVPAVERADRMRAHDALSIPAASLSRATSIRVAEALGCSRLVTGSFEPKGADVTLSLRILDVSRGTLSAPLMAAGPLETLPALVRSLAWDVALAGPAAPTTTRDTFLGRDGRPAPPLEAQKAYGQALATRDAPARLTALRSAVARWPGYDEARLALARAQLESRESAAALETLARVGATSRVGRSARFLSGQALLDLGRYRDAAALYLALLSEQPTTGVLNNYAIALLRAGGPAERERASDVLHKAVELGPGTSEPPFNLGWALLFEGEPEGAAFWLRGVLREDPRDFHARIVLVWSLRQAGREQEADAEWKDLVATAPSYEPFGSPDLGRRFERVMASENPPTLDQDDWGDPQLVASHLGRAEKLSEAGDLDGALRELTQAAYLDPYGAIVHRQLGKLYRARSEGEKAQVELRMSLWCRDDAAVRLELAVVLHELGRVSEAKAEAERVLRTDPSKAEAREIVEGRR